jgi:hypothetical protein
MATCKSAGVAFPQDPNSHWPHVPELLSNEDKVQAAGRCGALARALHRRYSSQIPSSHFPHQRPLQSAMWPPNSAVRVELEGTTLTDSQNPQLLYPSSQPPRTPYPRLPPPQLHVPPLESSGSPVLLRGNNVYGSRGRFRCRACRDGHKKVIRSTVIFWC